MGQQAGYLDVGVVKYVSENYITLIIRMHPCSEHTLYLHASGYWEPNFLFINTGLS